MGARRILSQSWRDWLGSVRPHLWDLGGGGLILKERELARILRDFHDWILLFKMITTALWEH